ncbi:hypothetical protein C3F09_04185 [candidate division GN15 bacterium]|uniref:N-acetyltransferase domain-containing protein n=1 Tax=candidate division GN15 bacterium TaxID=2072418 RepID=A0A855X438_9BACT|nr:MAG: hypothetical protein C3F09_04185 [candidate division GN15 bacterium]
MADKKPTPMTAPSLIGDNIYLRPATAEDMANTHHWRMLSEPQSMGCRPMILWTAAETAENFKKHERSATQQQFMIVRKADNVPVGRINFFDLNTLNRSTEVGLIIDPDERRKGYAVEATRLLCRYLFKYRGLNKVHAQTSDFNEGAKKLLHKAGFKKDGVLRKHYFWQGEFHDGLIYSVLAFEFD